MGLSARSCWLPPLFGWNRKTVADSLRRQGLKSPTVLHHRAQPLIQLICTVFLSLCYSRDMIKSTLTSEASSAVSLAGELRISLGKLIRRVREQAHPGDFTSAQKSVLLRLDRDGPATVSALARAESVRPQSMRITVAGLEAMKAVRGKPDPTDGRQTLVDLTPGFRKTLKASRAAKDDWLVRALQAQLSPQEQGELAAAVKLLQRLADF